VPNALFYRQMEMFKGLSLEPSEEKGDLEERLQKKTKNMRPELTKVNGESPLMRSAPLLSWGLKKKPEGIP